MGEKSSKAEASYLEQKPEMTEDNVWPAEEVTSIQKMTRIQIEQKLTLCYNQNQISVQKEET
jgi:hypothetical protein